MTEYRLVSEPRADLDVEAAFEWYENERPGLGLEFLGALRAAYNSIAAGPLKYHDLRAGVRRALLKRFSLFGPPGIIFFDAEGREIKGLRVIGYQNPERFLKTLSLATAP